MSFREKVGLLSVEEAKRLNKLIEEITQEVK